MNPKQIGIIVCRGAGLLLLVFGLSNLLPILLLEGSGQWTTYAPISSRPPLPVWLIVFSWLRLTAPALVQLVSGSLLLLFSRSIGALLAAGLLDRTP